MSGTAIVIGVGAEAGLGAALARRFAREGLHVLIGARRRERIEALAAALRARGLTASAVATDATFKPAAELRKIYFDGAGVDASKPTIAYCRIGERSSHTWFVLKYLLGLDDVRNYDGSWTEYGNLIGVPIER